MFFTKYNLISITILVFAIWVMPATSNKQELHKFCIDFLKTFAGFTNNRITDQTVDCDNNIDNLSVTVLKGMDDTLEEIRSYGGIYGKFESNEQKKDYLKRISNLYKENVSGLTDTDDPINKFCTYHVISKPQDILTTTYFNIRFGHPGTSAR